MHGESNKPILPALAGNAPDDFAQAREYCAGIEHLAREARTTTDLRVLRDALCIIALQAETILGLGIWPDVRAPARTRNGRDREADRHSAIRPPSIPADQNLISRFQRNWGAAERPRPRKKEQTSESPQR